MNDEMHKRNPGVTVEGNLRQGYGGGKMINEEESQDFMPWGACKEKNAQ